jgi:tRNA/rRNA methyltransferase
MSANVTTVLVRPSRPMNIGAVARVMGNFGFRQLIIVNPTCNAEEEDARRTARHASSILEQARVIPSLEEALSDLDFRIGTTARQGGDHNLPRVALPPRFISECELGPNTAVIFGPEDDGLSNKEIEMCNLLISIPTSSSYRAMNLSHAVAIVLYELALNPFTNLGEAAQTPHREASDRERTILLEQAEKWLELISYHPERRHKALQVIKNAFMRGYLSGREINTLIGVIKYTNSSLAGKNPVWRRLAEQTTDESGSNKEED